MRSISDSFEEKLLGITEAKSIGSVEVIQELWSGYGKILRIGLDGATVDSIVAKHVQVPGQGNHPRGWNTSISHERKLKSYQVESHWYLEFSSRCDDSCRVPKCHSVDTNQDEVFLILEDLDAAGYPARLTSVDQSQIERCLDWLANFHAEFMGEVPEGLWEVGTYWHLDTRPDELEVLDDLPLKQAAAAIDSMLNNARFQTFVHGDAKLANFCFSENGDRVAAVDFQYIGGGCGMKDVAYFIGSCLDEASCERNERALLEYYFASLERALSERNSELPVDEIVAEWRQLYPVAWTDFHRFLKGWCPGHWKINGYSEKLSRSVIKSLTA